MSQFIYKLSQHAWLRNGIRMLRLHRLGNLWLHFFPVVKQLPGSRLVYRARRLESIALGTEFFELGGLYDSKLLPAQIDTFADLGCNVGYFGCWLARFYSGRQLSGLMIDGNAEAVEEAKWHIQKNGMTGVHALYGLAGKKGNGTADFYLHVSNVCSTDEPPQSTVGNDKAAWKKVTVPCLRVEEHWAARFGGARCNLLKIDIEGSELDFLLAEPDFLGRVDNVLLEWHKRRVTLKGIETLLNTYGFKLFHILTEDENMGTCYFKRDN